MGRIHMSLVGGEDIGNGHVTLPLMNVRADMDTSFLYA